MKEIIVSFFFFFPFSRVLSFSNDKIFRGNVRETSIKKYLHFFSSFFFPRCKATIESKSLQVYVNEFTRISNWATQYESWKLVEIESSERCKFFVHRPYFEIKNRFLEFNFESNFPRMATSRVKLSPLLARKVTKLFGRELSILEKSKFSCNKIFLFLPSFLLFLISNPSFFCSR